MNPEFIDAAGRPIVINPRWVAAVMPKIEGTSPVLGYTNLLMAMPLPNVPGIQNIAITVCGDYREVACKLRLIHDMISVCASERGS